MNAVCPISPNALRQFGNKQEFLKLPKLKPEFATGFHLIAIIGSGTNEETKDVSLNADYDEMYADATKVGCPYTVTLYTVHVEFLN